MKFLCFTFIIPFNYEITTIINSNSALKSAQWTILVRVIHSRITLALTTND